MGEPIHIETYLIVNEWRGQLSEYQGTRIARLQCMGEEESTELERLQHMKEGKVDKMRPSQAESKSKKHIKRVYLLPKEENGKIY